jgi:hypothetical protein
MTRHGTLMHQYRFHQAAGGQGTTICALGVAVIHAELGKQVLYVTDRRGPVHELGIRWESANQGAGGKHRLTGTHGIGVAGGNITAHTGIPLLSSDMHQAHMRGYDIVITDGTLTIDGYKAEMYKHGHLADDVWCVMGPGYAELAKLMDRFDHDRAHSDWVLVTKQHDRSLGERDVAATLGAAHGEIIELPWEPGLYRNLDAGLISRISKGAWGKKLGRAFAWTERTATATGVTS